MRSSDSARALMRNTSTRRSVEFATIDEEPAGFNLQSSHQTGVSDISITLDDLDPRALHENRSSLEINTTTATTGRASRLSSTAYTSAHTSAPSRQASSQSGVISAIRRFTRDASKFVSSRDVGGGQQEQQQQQQQQGTNPPSFGSLGANVDRSDRRATIFTRQRRSIASRSSMTTSATNSIDDSNAREAIYCLSDTKIHFLRRIIDHKAWHILTLFFILVMLFGPPIQDMWLPKSADDFMEGLYTLSFIILALDIILRSIIDKSYFAWNRQASAWSVRAQICKCCAKSKCCNIHFGSFMFWFDSIALMTIYWKLSYVNPHMSQPMHVGVDMNELGFPVGIWHATPLSINWSLILTVGRVALMARFIRTSYLVHLATSIGWLKYFYPKFWLRKLAKKCRKKRDEKMNPHSQIVLASSSRGRPDLDSSDPFSVSSLGDSRPSRRLSRRISSRGVSFHEPLGGVSEESDPDVDEVEETQHHKNTNLKEFFKGFGKKTSGAGSDSLDEGNSPSHAKTVTESLLLGANDPKDSRSHVGAAMRELTGQRIAMGALMALLVTVICSWQEKDTTNVMTMLTLHGQTANAKYAEFSVNVAHSSVIPTLFSYRRANSTNDMFSVEYPLSSGGSVEDLRQREILSVDIRQEGSDEKTYGLFDNRAVVVDYAQVELVTTIVILLIWILGVASFASPVMTLVVEPIERMVRLLSMLMKDPLGYQNTEQYRRLKKQDGNMAEGMWPSEVLKGMETNFLMSTILRIGSLMRVGFGSAGVEIIRNNLERGRHKDVLFLSKQGGSVSCIFMFCDIRQFTDATECLQEEVFVFTNKIAAVVHSICHSYGGSANKNIGDAFLLSWLLDEAPDDKEEDEDDPFKHTSSNLNLGDSDLYANSNQADRALLSVVKISMALHYDKFFTDGMNEAAKNRLLTKLSKRKGPIVQMGFGLHAGKAVQGAIGSQRKIDATYISESVERSEFLESSTKRYGVPLLMSDAFYNLLSSYNKYRCRKVDQLIMLTEENEGLSDPHELLDSGEKMNIYTFDMDIDALWSTPADDDNSTTSNSDTGQRHTVGHVPVGGPSNPVSSLTKRRSNLSRRSSFTLREIPGSLTTGRDSRRRGSSFIPYREGSSTKDLEMAAQAARLAVADENAEKKPSKTLVLPTGVHHYHERAWLEPDIKKIRHAYVANGIIFPKFQEGLKSYFAKDWERAKKCFEFVLAQRDDGPSRYFLGKMAEHNGVPPRNFTGYTIERV